MFHAVARSTRPITSIKGPQGWRLAQLSYWRQSQPPGACSRSGGGLEEGECVAFWECFLHECSSALSQAVGWWLTSPRPGSRIFLRHRFNISLSTNHVCQILSWPVHHIKQCFELACMLAFKFFLHVNAQSVFYFIFFSLTHRLCMLHFIWCFISVHHVNADYLTMYMIFFFFFGYEWMMHLYSAFCGLLYTQSDLQSCWGSLLNHHQCGASTWMMRRLPQDNGTSAFTTHQLQVERRERDRANQVDGDY